MTIKFYSAKSKATRALADSFGVTDKEAQAALLVQGDDGRWGFDLDAVKTSIEGSNYVKPEEINVAPGVIVETVTEKSVEIPHQEPAQQPATTITAAPKKPSAKTHIRDLMASGNKFTMDQLMLGGYSLSNIKTALSDLKNSYYSDGPVLIVKRTRIEGVDFYQIDAAAMIAK